MTQAKRKRKWSGEVTEHSNALDVERDVFKDGSATEIAQSLKRSAEASRRKKSSPFRAAISMLTFYINRAGRNLPAQRGRVLETAKDKLRGAFGRGAGIDFCSRAGRAARRNLIVYSAVYPSR